MSSRAYLSIGDVLTLLREEFPDVTISKIRFLESQGLVNPERSPSGYRKFYEQDVERLRWVLRQQREHFLPLKVIRDRLAHEVPEDPEPVPAAVGATESHLASESVAAAPVAEAPVAEAPAPRPARVGVGNGMSGHSPSNGAAGGSRAAVAEPELAAAPAHGAASIRPAAPAVPEREAAATRAQAEPERAQATPTRPEPARPPAHARGGEVEGGASGGPPTPPDPPAAEPPAPERPAPARATSARPRPGASGAAEGPKEPTAPASARHALAAGLSGVSLTLEEFCSAAELTTEQVHALGSFGLIEPMAVAGVEYYDEEALTVGRLAAEFARFGIEPRHLRQYRNAADREIGLVEQVIMPLLRQRNPEARQRAIEAAGDIARLGEGLRASLVRQGLRRELGN